MRKLFLFSILFLVSFIWSSLYIKSVSLDKQFYRPGESGVLTVNIENTYLLSSSGTPLTSIDDLQSVSIDISSHSSVKFSSVHMDVGDLGPGESLTLAFPFKVSEDAESGNAFGIVKAYGFVMQSVSVGNKLRDRQASFSIPILEEPAIELTLPDFVFFEGEPVNISFVNKGGSAFNVGAYVSGDVSLVGSDKVIIGNLGPGEKKAVPVRLSILGGPEGTKKATVSLSYVDSLGNQHLEERNAILKIKKKPSDIEVSISGSIISGEESQISIVLFNKGQDARDVRLTLSSNSISFGLKSDYEIGDLKTGDTVTINTTAFTEQKPSISKVSALIEYVSMDRKELVEESIPVKVSQKSSIGFYVENKPDTLEIGKEASVYITLSNLGTYDISGAEVSVSPENASILGSGSVQYVGSMEKDESSTVQFKVLPTSEFFSLLVTATYKDSLGSSFSQKKRFVFHAVRPSTNESALPYLFVIAILGIGAYLYTRKRK